MLNVFLAIAVDNLADADALGENDAKEAQEEEITYEVIFKLIMFYEELRMLFISNTTRHHKIHYKIHFGVL